VLVPIFFPLAENEIVTPKRVQLVPGSPELAGIVLVVLGSLTTVESSQQSIFSFESSQLIKQKARAKMNNKTVFFMASLQIKVSVIIIYQRAGFNHKKYT
jgi:hypothetical protein